MNLLLAVVLVLVILWLFAHFTFAVTGALINALLVVALIVFIVWIVGAIRRRL